jgi:hypothetical protein
MTPHEFIAKWKPVDLSERSACHEHFLDLCELLGQPKPAASDPDGSCYPRLVAKDEECAKELKKRSLTSLYNQEPTWLKLAHQKLDEAVFAAYGWPADLSDEQILEKLLALNLERAAEEASPSQTLESAS